MSNVLRDRPPRLEQIRVTGHEIDAALRENPLLPDAAAFEFGGQREAASGVIPEEIVGDKDVVAHAGEVVGDRTDRSLANRAVMQLPNRAEGAAERTAASRFDQPDRPMREAGVFPSVMIDQAARRQRHFVEGGRPELAGGLRHAAFRIA